MATSQSKNGSSCISAAWSFGHASPSQHHLRWAMFRYRQAKPTMAMAGILLPPTLMRFLPFAVLFLPATLEMFPSRHPHMPLRRVTTSIDFSSRDRLISRSRPTRPRLLGLVIAGNCAPGKLISPGRDCPGLSSRHDSSGLENPLAHPPRRVPLRAATR